MAKRVDDSVLDGTLDIINTSTVVFITDAEPADRAAAVTASLIGTHTMTGSMIKAAGTPSGREIATVTQSDVDITTSGTANHVCLANDTTLLLVTTCTSQGLSSGGTVTIPSFVYTSTDPT